MGVCWYLLSNLKISNLLLIALKISPRNKLAPARNGDLHERLVAQNGQWLVLEHPPLELHLIVGERDTLQNVWVCPGLVLKSGMAPQMGQHVDIERKRT